MTNFNVTSFLNTTRKEYGLSKGEYLKAKEGDNRMRLLSEPVAHQGSYKGQSTFKFLMFVLDRADNLIKPYFMPVMIMENISQLQLDNDWGFDGFPMPYDINIRAIGAGTKEVKYSVIASPNREPIAEDILAELATKDIKAFQKKLNEASESTQNEDKAQETAPVQPQSDVAPHPTDEKVINSIPF